MQIPEQPLIYDYNLCLKHITPYSSAEDRSIIFVSWTKGYYFRFHRIMADVKSTSDVSDEEYLHYFNNSFIHSEYFYSASSPPLKSTTTRRRSSHSTDIYCAGISRRSATGNSEGRTCPR